jgi:hypothetical protein
MKRSRSGKAIHIPWPFRPFGPQGNLLDDYTVKAKKGYNAWFGPSKVSRSEARGQLNELATGGP